MTVPPQVPALSVEGLVSAYGRNRVHEDVSLTVEAGRIVGLVGLNGVGKTTLIRAILDLFRPQAGRISLFGEPHESPAARRHLAYLPERYQPSPSLTGWDAVKLALAHYGMKAERERTEEQLRGFAFDPSLLGRRIGTYSKGTAQKLGLALTLMTERPLLVLDEPMSGLDPAARSRLKDRLLAYRQAGGAVFFSSHILADLDEVCDAVVVLHAGKIVYLGAPAGLKAVTSAPTLERAFLAVIGEAA